MHPNQYVTRKWLGYDKDVARMLAAWGQDLARIGQDMTRM